MIASGVPIFEALDICGRTAGNKVIENAVMKVRDNIAKVATLRTRFPKPVYSRRWFAR